MKIIIKKKLKEVSAMGGGMVAGHVDNREEIEEISQSSAIRIDGGFPKVSGEEEHAGHNIKGFAMLWSRKKQELR